MEATLTKKDGKVQMDKSFEFMCSTLRNGEYTITIKRKTHVLVLACVNTLGKNIGAPAMVFKTYTISIVRNSLENKSMLMGK
jgi:hypothetical protein